jgi:hypothetical protein
MPSAPRTTPRPGISFKETMRGGVALGSIDPAKGARIGPTLVMHATIVIDDIAAFVADPLHRAHLTGQIDYAPLGTGLQAETGVFGLFCPSGDPKLTFMVYELGFAHAGQRWYLAGKKHVRVGSPLHLWPETTTLFATLHQGPDAQSPVAGAGVLRLGAPQLLALLGTLHATQAPGLGARMSAVTQFMGFFSRELLRTYILQRPRA